MNILNYDVRLAEGLRMCACASLFAPEDLLLVNFENKKKKIKKNQWMLLSHLREKKATRILHNSSHCSGHPDQIRRKRLFSPRAKRCFVFLVLRWWVASKVHFSRYSRLKLCFSVAQRVATNGFSARNKCLRLNREGLFLFHGVAGAWWGHTCAWHENPPKPLRTAADCAAPLNSYWFIFNSQRCLSNRHWFIGEQKTKKYYFTPEYDLIYVEKLIDPSGVA